MYVSLVSLNTKINLPIFKNISIFKVFPNLFPHTSFYVLAFHSLNNLACLIYRAPPVWILLITLMCICLGVLITSLLGNLEVL